MTVSVGEGDGIGGAGRLKMRAEEQRLIVVDSGAGKELQDRGAGAGQLHRAQQTDIGAAERRGLDLAEVNLTRGQGSTA
jgi:hypothetical protein